MTDHSQVSSKTMIIDGSFLDLVDRLSADRPLQPDHIAAVLGIPLNLETEQSNPYYLFFDGRSTGIIQRIELRVPRSMESKPDGMLILELSPHNAISEPMVVKKYGANAELLPPSPRQPPDAPLYLVYRNSWGTISFGFSRDALAALSVVVIDATKEIELAATVPTS